MNKLYYNHIAAMAGFVKKNCKVQASAGEFRALNFRFLTNERGELIVEMNLKKELI